MENKLNNKMKRLEHESRFYIEKNDFYVLRMDGFELPFDNIFRNTMNKTTLELCKQMQGSILGFTQSDEITIILSKKDNKNQIPYNGNIQKISSTFASKTSILFNNFFHEECKENDVLDKYNKQLFNAEFDCRLFSLSKEDIFDCLLWRWKDCKRNAINMIGRCYFSHNQLDKVNTNELIEMLNKKSIFIDSFKTSYIYGTILFKEKVILNKDTEKECERKKWFLDYNQKNIDKYKIYLEQTKS